ncbi:hypothetical protein [uncultured Limnohabitans sp.]|uniref:hypothetical protein n=1 Tax=uncultured Limnohabitans sp. TaxID=768543 RepID=UPI002615D260|nr:hypothetical protein [uncultured Limnohabitans sp.]
MTHRFNGLLQRMQVLRWRGHIGQGGGRSMSHSAVAYTPIPTEGSPFSMRMSVGTETAMRLAQARRLSLRR